MMILLHAEIVYKHLQKFLKNPFFQNYENLGIFIGKITFKLYLSNNDWFQSVMIDLDRQFYLLSISTDRLVLSALLTKILMET